MNPHGNSETSRNTQGADVTNQGEMDGSPLANGERPAFAVLGPITEYPPPDDGYTNEENEAIPLEQAVADGLLGINHKGTKEGIPLSIDDDRYDNVGSEGGVTWVNGHAISVRAPVRRFGGTRTIHAADVMELRRLTNAGSRNSSIAQIGFELETLEIDYGGHLQGDPPSPDDKHPEAIIGCVEEATTPSSSLLEAAEKYLQMQKDLRARAAAKGRLSYTGSNLGDRPLTPADLNTNDKYIGPMIAFVGGPDVAAQVDGVSQQDHIDDTGTAAASAWAFNVEELLAPIDMALTAASPFSRGELRPDFDLRNPYPKPDAEQGYGAARLFGRVALPEGGVILQFIPEDLEGQVDLIDQRMRAGLHNPTRVVGAHANRWRVDYGGRENSATDTNGGHIESSMSLVALNRAFRHILQQTYDQGDVERLQQAYARIVQRTLEDHQRERAMINSVSMAQSNGLDGRMIALDSSVCSGMDLLEDKIRLVSREIPPGSPYHVNKEMLRWIRLRATMPKTIGDFILDNDGVVSAEGFFVGRPGPLAAHMRARVFMLVRRGISPPDAIANMQADVAHAHNRYLDRIQPKRDLGFLAMVGEAA